MRNSVRLRFGSPQKLSSVDTAFVILLLTVTEAFRWLAQLPSVMQNHSGGDSVCMVVDREVVLFNVIICQLTY